MSNMSERLLATLDAVTARDEVAQEAISKPQFTPGVDYDKETGEWLGEPPEGYQPIPDPPSLEDIESKDSKVPDFDKSDATVDYRRVRDTTYAMQEATMFMMGQAAKLAASTEAPRAFSVFRELGELMRGLNKDLMENQKTFKAVTANQEPPEETEINVTTSPDGSTTVSVGKTARSSRDLLKMIEQAATKAEARQREKEVKPTEEVTDVEVEETPPENTQPSEPEENSEEVKDNGVS